MKSKAKPDESEKSRIREWAKRWAAVAPELEKIRAEDIRNADTVRAMEILDGMFDHAAKSLPARESSGLIEQQQIFSRARK